MDTQRRRLVIVAATSVLSRPVLAALGGEVLPLLPNAQKIGEGELTYLGFSVYWAQLWASDGKYSADRPFALSLTYRRDIARARIVEASITSMSRLGAPVDQHPEWATLLEKVLRDVSERDNITGVFYPGQYAEFFFNQKPTGRIDAVLAKYFADIWLHPDCSEPALRRALLGQSQ